ncbi:MAG: hypothetical protein ACKOZT_00170, partial [Cyanobium sp.]
SLPIWISCPILGFVGCPAVVEVEGVVMVMLMVGGEAMLLTSGGSGAEGSSMKVVSAVSNS